MWAVTNRTRFSADRAFVRDRDGAEIWIVAVRATFAIGTDGAVTVAEEQEAVCAAPVHFGEAGRSSLRYDADLVQAKAGTDVLLHAHAHAPYGRPAPVVDVAVAVGPLRKRLRVHGDRVWKDGLLGLSPGEATPFVTMPIRYERAWGGAPRAGDVGHPLNPVGVGVRAVAGAPVPNCEYPESPVESPRHRGPPAGFGPIPRDWQPRRQLAGTYDAAWQRDRQPLPPADFQDAYFRCAPADQQLSGFLHGGEPVELRNLTPEGVLRFRLPRVSLRFDTHIDEGTSQHRGRLHTVVIEPEARRLIMVWQTALPCHHTLYTLQRTIVTEKPRVPLGTRSAPHGAQLA